MKYEKLFSKGRIGRLEIKNRAVMSPMATDFANPDGTASERLIRYYEERAKGGIGLIINEYTGVDDVDSIPTPFNLRAARDYHMTSLEQLTDAVHRHDCKIFAQIHHGGSTSKAALTGRQSLSASDVPIAPGAPAPRPMTIEEIKAVEQKFIDAAVRCQKAGYDGVELHGAHSYLLGQFFSPYYNKRTDEYGGSLENRMRLIDEIIAGVRKACGPNFVISVRICGDEMTPDVPDTLNLQDGLDIGRHLEAQGIDVINISNGSGLNANANCDPYSYQPGWKKHVAAAFKKALKIPVIATNTIKDPDFAESLLEEGVCDFVALGRSQFADPYFMKKTAMGKTELIRKCIGCMYCRERLLGPAPSVACAVNPLMGREYNMNRLDKNGNGRPVAVIGAGVGGMEAAIILAKRGFKVTLFEQSNELGGTLNIAKVPNFKDKLQGLTDSMAAEMKELGVDIKLNTKATPEMVKELSPVGVFVATGARPIIPKLPGIDSAKVSTAEQVLMGESAPSGKVALIGTGMTGLETGELLAEKGCEVTFVEMQPTVAPGLFAVLKNDIMGRLNKLPVSFLTGHKLTAVTESGVELEKADGEKVSVAADYVVLSIGIAPTPDVIASFEAVFPTCTFRIGDAVKPGKIAHTIKDGFDRAYSFQPDLP